MFLLTVKKFNQNSKKPIFSKHSIFCRTISKSSLHPTTIAKVPPVIRPRDLASRLGIPLKEVLKFFKLKNFRFEKHSDLVVTIDHARELARLFNIQVEVEEVDVMRRDYWDPDNSNPSKNPRRPMIVSVMGHVDHGKTTLLDAFRKSNVAAGEPGGITQSLSAFRVRLLENAQLTNNPKKEILNLEKEQYKSSMTMLDTPGHAAFFLMRENSSSVSDFIILIIAADEGIQSQTEECINLATDTNVPIIVAINKIDISSKKKIENVYSQLHKRNLLNPEITKNSNPYNSGGDAKMADIDNSTYPVKGVVEISALKSLNLETLKKALFQHSDLIQQHLHPEFYSSRAECTVIEAHYAEGLGQMLRVIVHWGQLEPNMWFVSDKFIGKIKSLFDEGAIVEKAWPGDPVSISGLKSDIFPPSGSGFFTLPKEEAEKVHEFRNLLIEYRVKEMNGLLYLPEKKPKKIAEKSEAEKLEAEKSETEKSEPENSDPEISKNINPEKESGKPESTKLGKKLQNRNTLPVIVKADNVGRLETILGLLENLATEKGIDVSIIVSGVGDVTSTDLYHARIEVEDNQALKMPIYCFGETIGLEANARTWLAKHQNDFPQIRVRHYQIIYDIVKDIKNEMNLLKLETKKNDHPTKKRRRKRR